MKPESPEKVIDEILFLTNWSRIHSVMQFLDWKWVKMTDLNGSLIGGVPTMQQIEASARDLLTRTYAEGVESGDNHYYIATGGLQATYIKYDDCARLELTFLISDETNLVTVPIPSEDLNEYRKLDIEL